MNGMTLYIGNKNYSSWSLRPWLLLKHIGVPFTEVLLPLDQPDTARQIKAQSPSGRVPALHDGDLVVWDSLAIGEYLGERFPEARLLPTEIGARARARSVTCEMHSGFAALREHLPMNVRRQPRPAAPGDAAAAVHADIERVIEIWTDCRRRAEATGPFLFGTFGLGDAFFAPVVARFRSYAVPLQGAAHDYAAAVWEHPAMKEWVAAAHAETLRVPKYEHTK